MNSNIQEQIASLTQELRPYPETRAEWFWYFSTSDDESFVDSCLEDESEYARRVWRDSEFCSFNKAEVEEYADCYRRLKLYQLLGKKAEKDFPLNWRDRTQCKYATSFVGCAQEHLETGLITCFRERITVLGGVWFANESDRLHALSVCGIDRSFQEKCARFGLGGVDAR